MENDNENPHLVSDFAPGSAATKLWDQYIKWVTEVKAARAKQDKTQSQRANELEFLSTLKTPEGIAIHRKAVQTDLAAAAKKGARDNEDLISLKTLFRAAIFTQLKPEDAVIPDHAPSNNADQHAATYPVYKQEDGSPSSGQHDNPSPNAAKLSIVPITRTTITMDQVEPDSVLSPYPKNGTKHWYALQCPLCQRKFESSHGAFGHMAQSDMAHLRLFGGAKNFKKAVEVCGTKVIDALHADVLLHNESARKIAHAQASRSPRTKIEDEE